MMIGNKTVLRGLFAATVVALFASFTITPTANAVAGINSQISFQGKLVNTNGTNIADGTYNLQFKIYEDGTETTGGTLRWTGSHLVSAAKGIVVNAGTFQVNLGSVNDTTALSAVDFNQDTMWLSMNVGGTATTPVWDGEMTPRIRLTSVPYALNAGKVGGIAASDLVRLSGTQQTGAINVSGSVTAGGALSVGGQTVISGGGKLQNVALDGSVVYTNLNGVGTITAGTWNASVIAPTYGGTGNNSYSIGDLLVATGTTTLGKLSTPGGNTCLLSSGAGTAPSYQSCITVGPYAAGNTAANGATLAGNTLTFQSASATAPGMVDTGVQSFAGAKTFTATLQVGSATTDATLIDFQFDSYNAYDDSSTGCTSTNNQGSMYYNTAVSTMRACINGAWEDLVSTGGLGLLAFGVVPDSSNAGTPGELAGINQTTSPCKVYWASATSVTVAPCYAYSGGRKVTVPSTTLSLAGIPLNNFRNVCLNGTNGAPALSATGSTVDSATSQPTWTANNPILCIATIQIGGTTAGSLAGTGKIYDTRTFTTTQKSFATTNTAVNNGFVVVQSATANLVAPTATAATGGVRGVVVAYSGAVSTTTANVIIASQGPQWVKSTGGAIGQSLQTSTTAGYGVGATLATATTAATPVPYLVAGVVSDTIDTTCTSNATCQYSMFMNPLNIR